MKKVFIVLFLSFFVFSCSKEQNIFENNLKCADIAIKYTDIMLKKYSAKEDNLHLLIPFLREYFYSENRNTCIGVFYSKNEFNEYITTVIDLLNNQYLHVENGIKTINSDF